MAKDHGSSVKDDKTYEEVRKSGASKEKAARVANAKAGGGNPFEEGREGLQVRGSVQGPAHEARRRRRHRGALQDGQGRADQGAAQPLTRAGRPRSRRRPERHRERRVESERAAAPGRRIPATCLPADAARQLVHAGEDEAERRRGQHGRGDELARRRPPRRVPASRRRRAAGRARARRSWRPARRGSVTSPIESQVPARMPMPVPATTSRARKPKIEVTQLQREDEAR